LTPGTLVKTKLLFPLKVFKKFNNFKTKCFIKKRIIFLFYFRLETVSADSFITFNCERSTASIVSRARSALDSVIEEKVTHPSSTCWQSSQGRILNLIVSLLDTELEGLQFEEEEEEQGSNQRGEPGYQRFENSFERGEGKDGRNLRGKDRTRGEGERLNKNWSPW